MDKGTFLREIKAVQEPQKLLEYCTRQLSSEELCCVLNHYIESRLKERWVGEESMRKCFKFLMEQFCGFPSPIRAEIFLGLFWDWPTDQNLCGDVAVYLPSRNRQTPYSQELFDFLRHLPDHVERLHEANSRPGETRGRKRTGTQPVLEPEQVRIPLGVWQVIAQLVKTEVPDNGW